MFLLYITKKIHTNKKLLKKGGFDFLSKPRLLFQRVFVLYAKYFRRYANDNITNYLLAQVLA